jgi:2,3-bisphosphoglycerate-dependent phosphoglycerate mutase
MGRNGRFGAFSKHAFSRPAGAPRRGASLLTALLVLCTTGGAARAQTVVYLVRHAEPTLPAMGSGADPHLGLAGQERAHALRHLLEQAGITHVLSTDYNRTRETVTPLAEALGLQVEIYDARAPEALVERLKHTPGRFLVAGHSNTTPQMVALLGGDPGAPIDENYEFDRLYQVLIGADGTVTTTLLRYGAVSGR